MNGQREWAVTALLKACETRMYGRVTIILEDGCPVRVTTETTETPPKTKSIPYAVSPGLRNPSR